MDCQTRLGVVLFVVVAFGATASAQVNQTPAAVLQDSGAAEEPAAIQTGARAVPSIFSPLASAFAPAGVALETARAQAPIVPRPMPRVPDARAQYPAFLANSYIGVNVGSINYPFSSQQLEPGFQVGSIDVPHAAVRVTLFGHQFHKFLAAQIGYTRPVRFVKFENVGGTGTTHSLWMAMGDVTLKSQASLGARVSVYGEGGVAIVNRSGFVIDSIPVVKDTQFASPLFGTGLEFHLNRTWDGIAGVVYVPAHPQHSQPEITFGSWGFRYNMRPLTSERVEQSEESGFIFPHNVVQVGFTADTFGYGVNNALAGAVFWGGLVQIARGGSLRYSRNVFHTRRVFALDLGSSLSLWKTGDHQENFFSISVYPVLRFTAVRTRQADFYVMYSVAGPTFVTKRFIDNRDTGNRFTFQDLLGVGTFFGRRRQILLELGISHFSNGNLFAQNPGTKVPLTFSLGYGF